MKIICVGRNYANHAKELGNDVPDEAVLFIKPETALVYGDTFNIPDFSKDVHYELEIVLKINKTGKNISKATAQQYYIEIGLGIDFTARDLQSKLKAKGLPWEKAKAFDGSAYISPFILMNSIQNPSEISFELLKNDEVKQQGNSKDMLFDFDEIIVQASTYFTLEEGDLIMTGTPAGVGAVKVGDTLVGTLEGVEMFKLTVQ